MFFESDSILYRSFIPREGFLLYGLIDNFNSAIKKEADSLKEQGWTLRKWHYEATTCSFILTMQRPKGYVPDPEPKQDEDKKAGK